MEKLLENVLDNESIISMYSNEVDMNKLKVQLKLLPSLLDITPEDHHDLDMKEVLQKVRNIQVQKRIIIS